MTFAETFESYLNAGALGFWVSTHEEQRCVPELVDIFKRRKVTLYSWSQVSGPFNLTTTKSLAKEAEDLEDHSLSTFVRWLKHVKVGEKGEPYAVVLPNAHSYLKDGMIRLVQEEIFSKSGIYVIVSPQTQPPMELQRLISPVRYQLPTPAILARHVDSSFSKQLRARLGEAAIGLTVSEARIMINRAFEKAKNEDEAVQTVWDSKAEFFAERGLAKICIPTESLDDVGGCYHFKAWLRARKASFSVEGRERGIMPKGVLFVGPPGVGKSLLSRAIASELGFRYLEWDTGKLMDMYVGNTEHATDELLELSELHAPCVVRIEEVAHQLSGYESSGVTDSGVVARMIGKILTFMEERAKGLFFVMSTNEPQKLPPAFIRHGRLDGVWNLGLPTEDVLEDILRIHLRKYIPALEDSVDEMNDIVQFMVEEKFSGSEIRQVIIESLQTSFPKAPSIRDLEKTAREIIPESKMQSELVTSIEKWASSRARKA